MAGGGSPLQNLIIRGHTETMLTALRMVGELDAGPVYKKMPLTLDGSAEEIYTRAGRLGMEIIDWIIGNRPVPVPQVGAPVLFKRRKPEQSRLPDRCGLHEIHDFIRMLDAEGYPRAFLEIGGLRLEFSHSRLDLDHVLADVRITIKPEEENS